MKQAFQKSDNSAAGPDEVHYNLLSHFPESALVVLWKVYDPVWDPGRLCPMEESSRVSHSQDR